MREPLRGRRQPHLQHGTGPQEAHVTRGARRERGPATGLASMSGVSIFTASGEGCARRYARAQGASRLLRMLCGSKLAPRAAPSMPRPPTPEAEHSGAGPYLDAHRMSSTWRRPAPMPGRAGPLSLARRAMPGRPPGLQHAGGRAWGQSVPARGRGVRCVAAVSRRAPGLRRRLQAGPAPLLGSTVTCGLHASFVSPPPTFLSGWNRCNLSLSLSLSLLSPGHLACVAGTLSVPLYHKRWAGPLVPLCCFPGQ